MLIATAYLGVGTQPVEFAMNIELEEVVVQDVSDDALELAAGGALGNLTGYKSVTGPLVCCW